MSSRFTSISSQNSQSSRPQYTWMCLSFTGLIFACNFWDRLNFNDEVYQSNDDAKAKLMFWYLAFSGLRSPHPLTLHTGDLPCSLPPLAPSFIATAGRWCGEVISHIQFTYGCHRPSLRRALMSSVRGALSGHPVYAQGFSLSKRGENLPPAGSSHHCSGAVMNVAARFELHVYMKAAHTSVLY